MVSVLGVAPFSDLQRVRGKKGVEMGILRLAPRVGRAGLDFQHNNHDAGVQRAIGTR